MIIGAAVKVGDTVYTAPNGGGVCKHRGEFNKTRHCCVFNNNRCIHERVMAGEKSVQGFVTDGGEFLDRNQAGVYAFEHGQTNSVIECLFSEDLW